MLLGPLNPINYFWACDDLVWSVIYLLTKADESLAVHIQMVWFGMVDSKWGCQIIMMIFNVITFVFKGIIVDSFVYHIILATISLITIIRDYLKVSISVDQSESFLPSKNPFSWWTTNDRIAHRMSAWKFERWHCKHSRFNHISSRWWGLMSFLLTSK